MSKLDCHDLRNAIVGALQDEEILAEDEDDVSQPDLDPANSDSFFVTTHDDEKFHIVIVKVSGR